MDEQKYELQKHMEVHSRQRELGKITVLKASLS